MRAAFLLSSLFVCVPLFAADRPPAGVDIDELRTVDLQTSAPEDCLSLAFGPFSVLISMDRMSALIRAKPKAARTEVERQAAIAAGRAKVLVAMAGEGRDRFGCRTASGPISGDALYLLVGEIESGAVAIVNTQSRAFQEHAHVRYVGVRCGPHCGRGDILVGLPGGAHLLGINWWVS